MEGSEGFHTADDVAEIPITTTVRFQQTIIGVERDAETGDKILTIIDAGSATRYQLPLNEAGAGKLATDLVGGLEIARQLPPDASASNN